MQKDVKVRVAMADIILSKIFLMIFEHCKALKSLPYNHTDHHIATLVLKCDTSLELSAQALLISS